MNGYKFIKQLSRHLSPTAIIIPDTGMNLAVTCQAIELKLGQELFTQFSQAPMGYSICAGIGAYYATHVDRKYELTDKAKEKFYNYKSDREIVCIIGDGGFAMNSAEIETVVFNKIPLKIFIFDNNSYGIMEQTYKTWYNKSVATSPESGLGFPNIEKVCKAYGIKTVKLKKITDVKKIMKLKQFVCIVPIDKGSTISPKLKAGQRLGDIGEC